MNNWKLETMAVQGAYSPNNSEPRVLPLYQSTTFKYDTSKHMADLFDLKAEGHLYSRISNPTVDYYEKKVAMMEGGIGALATSSGQSAIMIAIMNIAKAGDSILASGNLYGGTYTLFMTTFKDMGIEVIFFDPDADESLILSMAKKNTKAVYTETLSNPNLVVADFEKLSAVSKALCVPFIVDNSFATGVLCRPIDFGADIVVLSGTKYLDGHAAAVGGIIVDAGTFDFSSGKFPQFTEPDQSYHGTVYINDFKDCPYIVKARVQLLRNTGMALSPFNAYMTNIGMETLHLRMERHCQNALKVAEFLSGLDEVSWVKYPGLKTDKYYGLACKYMQNGASGVLSFGLKGGMDVSDAAVNNFSLITIVTHVSDVRSCALQPAKTTHRQLNKKQLEQAGVLPEMIRLSVGIENVDDIIYDLKQAIKNSAV